VDAYSLTELLREREEVHKDWQAFMGAYDLLRRRLVESNDLDPPRSPLLHQWSGAAAVCGALELSLHAIERTRDEYDSLIKQVESGELANVDPPRRPKLTLVEDKP
jgi:hypothetical protein